MKKKILITGSTDGIGLETARILLLEGHTVLLHGRSESKLEATKRLLAKETGAKDISGYLYDLSKLSDVEGFADRIKDEHKSLDVLINNAGIYIVREIVTKEGLDVRFVVNTIAPYMLTKLLLPLLGSESRVVNLSSAAQAPVNTDAILKPVGLSDSNAYAQSKLALTIWSRNLGLLNIDKGPAIIAVNPGSLLGSKMVKEAYGIAGGDIKIGANVLVRASLGEEFKDGSGKYYDNDTKKFASPHPEAMDSSKTMEVMDALEAVIKR